MNQNKLIAFHGDQKIKDDIIAQLEAHYAADEIIKGVYWEDGKGCAVGCTIHSEDHSEYESRFGIPQILARLEDRIFEGLPNDLSKEWPLKFMRAINPGADLSSVWPKFAIFLLTDKDHGVIQYAKTKEQQSVIQQVSDLYSSNESINSEKWQEARKNAAAGAAYAAVAADAAGAAYADAAGAAYAAAAAAVAADAAGAAAASEKLIKLLSECK